MASWFDRSKPLKRRAGLDLMTGAALLLLVSGPPALAEDEPAARAPLPPLLRGAPAEAGERQMPDPAPSRNQSDPRAPAIRFDRPKSQLSQKKPRLHSASYLGTLGGQEARNACAAWEPFDGRRALSRQGHRTVASEKRQRRDRSPAEPEDRPAFPPERLSQSADREHHRAPSGAAASSTPVLSQLLCRSARIWLCPSYPYAWAPPGPGVFR